MRKFFNNVRNYGSIGLWYYTRTRRAPDTAIFSRLVVDIPSTLVIAVKQKACTTGNNGDFRVAFRAGQIPAVE
jgi:hypothetical protein